MEKELRELVAKVGWMKDCDFDEAIGVSNYRAPLVYATREVLLAANPDMKDPECSVYPQRVAVLDADELDAALAEKPRPVFQQRVREWTLACFGQAIADDKVERNHRFLEESLELVQTLGCTKSEAHQLVDYVFARPEGIAPQECGGVLVTLMALCNANGLTANLCGEVELERVYKKIEQIRAKQAAKPKHSPLSEPMAERPQLSAEQVQDAFEAEGHFDWAAIAKRLNALLTGEAEPSDYVCPRCKKAVPENAPCPYCVPAAPPVIQAESVRAGKALLMIWNDHYSALNEVCTPEEFIQRVSQTLQAFGFDAIRALADSPVSGRPEGCICSEAYGVGPDQCGKHRPETRKGVPK